MPTEEVMTVYTKGDQVAAGKTKKIFATTENPNIVIMENQDDITKNDDKTLTQKMTSKAQYATTTTCAVFGLLKEAGLPVAYEGQFSETAFLAPRCKMIGLEVIYRRYAVGSYLKRYPNMEKAKGEVPHRFHRLKFELFLKTTDGVILSKDGVKLGETPIDPEAEPEKHLHIDDPFIANPYSDEWLLQHPKKPEWTEESSLGCLIVRASDILPEGITVQQIETLGRKAFLVIEGAMNILGLRLIDIKLEFGIGPDGQLYIADVIDNDSWRLRTALWEELSKQLFRDNVDMVEIADKYALVAKLVRMFNIPNQALVLWRGSGSDNFPEIPGIVGIFVEEITLSGHKSPESCLNRLESILAKYPEGGVIIPVIGMSNGLGPTLAARTSWPVIACPATAKERPHDVWSSLEMPSQVPLLTILSPKNAVLAALNILAQKNPVAYMARQYAIEEMDAE